MRNFFLFIEGGKGKREIRLTSTDTRRCVLVKTARKKKERERGERVERVFRLRVLRALFLFKPLCVDQREDEKRLLKRRKGE